MKKANRQNFVNFAKYLLLAQVASDAGKDYYGPEHNSGNAQDQGYHLKDKYIRQAVSAAKKLPNVFVSVSFDGGMDVVLFDIKGYGQVSFHTFADFRHVKNARRAWNEIRGGSIKTCERIAKELNLQWYK
jgi:hypothetical protein